MTKSRARKTGSRARKTGSRVRKTRSRARKTGGQEDDEDRINYSINGVNRKNAPSPSPPTSTQVKSITFDKKTNTWFKTIFEGKKKGTWWYAIEEDFGLYGERSYWKPYDSTPVMKKTTLMLKY